MYFWEKKYKDALLPILMLQPFKREYLTNLRQGLGGKLQELQNQKLDQMPMFEDIYRKNFMKSLDHRSFQYKDFIRKFLQKQSHMTEIKLSASKNQTCMLRSTAELKGGEDSSTFHHTFGPFTDMSDLQADADFPIDMSYKDFPAMARDHSDKLPHQRLLLNDELAKQIAIKIFCLHIR